jgi:hypothetical protein
MAVHVSDRHLTGLLGTAGKAIATMPEGKRVVQQLKQARSRDELLFLLRSVDLSLADPARDVVTRAATTDWEDVRAAILRSAQLQLHERFDSSA